MLKRLMSATILAIVMAPALHAAASLPVNATSNMPWENFTSWVAGVLCQSIGICFDSIP